jgi:hypothetical protein
MRAAVVALLLLPLAVVAEEKRDDAAAEMAKGDDFFFTKKDSQSAIAHYNAARLLAPDKPGPYLALGLAYAATGDCKSATNMMQQYLKLKTTDAKPEAQKTIDDCKAKLQPACDPGMVKNADTADHCCWPSQVWVKSENRCVGTPACPPGFTLGPRGMACIATGDCPPGKVLSQDPKQCCWPGQGYSHEKKACVGVPVCPMNMVVAGEDCRPAPTGSVPGARPTGAPTGGPGKSGAPGPARPGGPVPALLNAVQIRQAMNQRVKPLVDGCYQQYRVTGQVRITFTVMQNGVVQRAQVLPPFAGSSLGACLEDTLRTATFPPHTGPVQTITYPFTLR